jgi:hypothetical protein
MLAPPERPTAALLVGVDYTAGGTVLAPEDAVLVPVIASLGPQLDSVSPATFEAGATLVIRGTGLASPDVGIEFHGAPLIVVERRPDGVEVTVPTGFNDAPQTSAGTWPLTAVRQLSGGRRRSSNPLVAGLRPLLFTGTPGADVIVNGDVYHTIDLGGRLLGRLADDAIAVLLRNGVTYGPYDRFVDPTVPPTVAQSERQLQIPVVPALAHGGYRLILSVNGQQARNSPVVNL